MKKLEDIIRNNGMSIRPEFYSGRGATLSDLDGKILEGIHKGIKKEYGENAGKNFIIMVADIKILSATTFLQELFQLFYNDWKYVKKKEHANGIAIQKNNKGEYDESSILIGMMGMFAAMGNNNRDDTERIRGHFIRSHGIKPKGGRRVYCENEDGFNYYYWEE